MLQKSLKISRSLFFLCATSLLVLCAATGEVQAQNQQPRKEDGESIFTGPSVHLGLGARFKQAPNLDLYDSPIGGVKATLFGVNLDQHAAIAFFGLGVNYVGDSRVAFSVTPLIFYHRIGVGIGIDFYTTREDRTGGPYGVTLNLDCFAIAKNVMRAMGQ